MKTRGTIFVFLLTSSLVGVACGWTPTMWNGRPAQGLPHPPVIHGAAEIPQEQFYDSQKLTHFDGSKLVWWKQRYFVNNATYRSGGPIFLVLGGNSEADPVWITQGAPYEYARRHGALLILLEHRFYGKSQPLPTLTTANLQYLSSRQALADTASFVTYFRWWNHVTNNTRLVVFGGSYAGSLAVWFREKYPTLCDGAVSSSAMIVAKMDFGEFFEGAGDVLDMLTGTQCRAEIHNATETMFDWYGQPEKRTDMHKMFRLCEKIDYSAMRDLNVLFNNIAQNFADIIMFNNVNRSIEGLPGESVSIKMACDVMTDMARGNSVQRYADVNNLYLDMMQRPCLNVRYRDLVRSMNYTMWNSTVNKSGSRQWLFQSCSEFGWFQSSSSQKQPFGSYLFPWNLTTDQCIDVFQRIFGGEEVTDNCDETNLYYGGLDLVVSNMAFVNGGADPWRAAGVTKPLIHSPNVDVIVIPGTGHCADMYPPSDSDPAPLTQARERISQLIGKWIH